MHMVSSLFALIVFEIFEFVSLDKETDADSKHRFTSQISAKSVVGSLIFILTSSGVYFVHIISDVNN